MFLLFHTSSFIYDLFIYFSSSVSINADAFVVLDYNSTSITVAWRDTNTNIIVNIDPQDDEARNVNVGERPVHTFTGLNPSTAYTITSLSQSQNLVTRVRTSKWRWSFLCLLLLRLPAQNTASVCSYFLRCELIICLHCMYYRIESIV